MRYKLYFRLFVSGTRYMQLKDYYTTLKVPPTATMPQIKKAFRQLALAHHPDKNPGNAAAAAEFQEIQEAYETLIDPEKRETYNYKRWYARSVHQPFVQEPLDPHAILNECLRLQDYMRSVSAMRIDFDGLSQHIRRLLNNTNIEILEQFNDVPTNTRIVNTILAAAVVLPYRYCVPVGHLLLRVAGHNDALVQRIHIFLQQQQQTSTWRRYRALIVIAITLLICWIIYMLGQ